MKMLSTGSKMQGFWLQFSENGLDKAPVLKTADTRSLKMYVRVLLFRCTSLYIGKGRVSAMPKLAAAYSYGHPCPF